MDVENVRNFLYENIGNEIIIKVESKHGNCTEEVIHKSSNEDLENKGQLCRLCANNINSGIYIFNELGREQQLADKINTCLPITVKVTDFLPKQLCISCSNKLNICFDFAETCVKAEKKLKNMINSVKFPLTASSAPMFSCFQINTEDVNEKQFDKIIHIADAENKSYCCPLCCEGNMVFQKEIQYTEQLDLSESHLKKENEIYSVPEDKYSNLESVIEMKEDIEVHQQKENLLSGSNSEESLDFPVLNIMCRFCKDVCTDLELCLAHSKYHADKRGCPCILCDIYFNSEIELKDHFKNHKFDTIESLQCESPKDIVCVAEDSKLCKCSECGKVFGTIERLSFHRQFHSENKPLTCERCSKGFNSENVLFRHMNLVHGGTEMCKTCGATFMSKAKLSTHICSLVNQPFKCKICSKQFQDTSLLRKHTAAHNFILAKPFQCSQCDASFTRISKLNNHVELTHSKAVTPQVCIKCNTCLAVFPNMEFTLLHIEKQHSSNSLNDIKTIEEIEATVLFCCAYCDALFTEMEHLIQHSSQHEGFNPYHCTFCNMVISDLNQMKFHKKYHLYHDNLGEEQSYFSIPLLYVCEACEKTFNTWKGLQIHYNFLHSGYPRNGQNAVRKTCTDRKEDDSAEFHLCEDCGESFNKRGDLRRHRLKVHRPQNKYPCEECGKVLLHYSGLIIHRRQHTGERPFMCDVCGKSFPQGPAMYTHRRIHTRDYPYRCEICNQTFNNKGDLNNHRRSKHTKERPFKCNICSKSFLTSGVFYQHKQLHAGIRKYKCSHCDRSFSRWNALSIHTKSHTGEKPHDCQVCGRGFAQKGDMKKHMKTQHGVIK